MIVENNKYIEEFISSIKKKYDKLVIGYDYDEEEDVYDIWHNSENLQYNDTDFLYFVGSLIKEKLYKNDIFNFSFGYDYYKSKELENKMNRYIFNIIEPEQIDCEYTEANDLHDYINNVDTNVDLQLKAGSIKVYFDYKELKSQRKRFSSTLFLESDLVFFDETIFAYNEFREAS